MAGSFGRGRGRGRRLRIALVAAAALVGGAAPAALYTYTREELTGPEQPIAFSHRVHAGTLGIACLYCHSSADRSQHASIPAVSVCMGCHQWVKKGSTRGSEQEIAKIAAFAARAEPIPWNRVHNLPEHVQFKHVRHVAAGIACQTCHGPVETMDRVWVTPDTRYRLSSLYLPARKLEMGWCVDCHRRNGATDDCAACHY